jgi:hypothetical protein
MNYIKRLFATYWIYSFIVLSALIALAFHSYFSLDEPNVLWTLRNGEAWSGYFLRVVAEGRPFLAYIQFNALSFAGTFENFRYVRILTIILLFLFCSLVFYFLRKKNMPKSNAFLISILIFSLPGFTVYIGWTLDTHCISILLSFYAGMLVTRVYEKYLGEPPLSRSKENSYIISAVILQIISLFIYQISALVFVVPAFFTLILNPESQAKKRIQFFAVTSVFFMICVIIYYKLFQSSLRNYNIPVSARGKMENIDIIGKFLWFIEVLKDASKLHLLLIKSELFSSIFSLGIAFVVIRDLIKKRFLDVLFLCLFSLLLFFPHLIIAESWSASRNFVFISMIFVFYALFRLFEMSPPLSESAAAFIGLAFIGMMCINLWEGWVKPMKQSYNIVHEFAKNLPDLASDTLFVKFTLQPINMYEKKSFLKRYSDEFNAPIFFNDWAVEPGLKCLYQDTHAGISLEKINKQIQLSKVHKEDSIPSIVDPHHFMLDLQIESK